MWLYLVLQYYGFNNRTKADGPHDLDPSNGTFPCGKPKEEPKPNSLSNGLKPDRSFDLPLIIPGLDVGISGYPLIEK